MCTACQYTVEAQVFTLANDAFYKHHVGNMQREMCSPKIPYYAPEHAGAQLFRSCEAAQNKSCAHHS